MSTVEVLCRENIDFSANIFSQVPESLAKVYAARGITDQAQLGRSLKDLLPDSGLKDINQAAKRIVEAISQDQKIIIIGDFDCDGATSTVVLLLGLRMMGAANVDYLIPNRFEFGYGLSPEIVEVAALDDPALIITVDNGVSSIEGVDRANQLGIDVVVTDHHLAGETLPKAIAIVNPNRKDCSFAAKSTCGVGVVFYLLIALRRAMQSINWFESHNIPVPNLASLLDLVALGTVADVVPLEHNNRTLVYQGIQRIRAGKTRPGLKALLEVANRKLDKLVASDLGFAVAPRLNAAGRLDDMSIGIECLLAEDEETARGYALQLDELNIERRTIEQGMQVQALQFLEKIEIGGTSNNQPLPMGLCLYNASWHQGVIGILASRIKDRLHRPVIAFAPGDKGQLKGSARSINGYHLRDGLALIDALHPGLIKKFGGHAMAAGLTIDADSLEKFSAAFEHVISTELREQDLKATLLTDGALLPADMNVQQAVMFRDAGPWGHHFSEPLFDNEFKVIQQRIVGKKHLKLVLMEPNTGLAIDAIYFNIDENIWPNESIEQVRVIYKLDVNEFRGKRSVQLMVEHIIIK
ncbi:MAG: single-stranded-DNA-specific exonuclease RecJ [Oceanospirillaceae bacterium]|nr:single-stranded-DNA-specific exonuclease RecJ [Oceanospirillaceae bacterium]